jgi:NAD(P)H-flavin reductase
MYHLLRHRRQYRRVSLLYGARTPDDLLFRRELEKWRSRLDTDIQVTVDRSTDTWRGNVGVVTTLIGKAPFDPAGCFALVCGPEVMMRFSVRSLLGRGVTPDRIFLSMERNMNCGIGQCGHCQWGPHFVCREGPVFRYDRIESLFDLREI